jgi:hypothetical protein
MEIDTIKNVPDPLITQEKLRDTARAAQPPRAETDEPKPEANRPAPPRRAATLISAVSQSLKQADLAIQDPTAVQGVSEATPSEASNNPESAQSEKVAQALQAFMHSLVQALNSERPAAGGGPAARESVARPIPSVESQTPAKPAADAYGGLVSRLESLVREIDGSQDAATASQQGLAPLDTAFKALVTAAADETGTGNASAANLQAVLKNMIRNLQSTGDPTLASTGNVINTAA